MPSFPFEYLILNIKFSRLFFLHIRVYSTPSVWTLDTIYPELLLFTQAGQDIIAPRSPSLEALACGSMSKTAVRFIYDRRIRGDSCHTLTSMSPTRDSITLITFTRIGDQLGLCFFSDGFLE